MAETILNRLFDEMHDAPLCNKLSNSELIRAMDSPILEIKSIAKIITERRGMQVIELQKE